MGLWFSKPTQTKKTNEGFNPPPPLEEDEVFVANDAWTNFRYLRNPAPNRVTSLGNEKFRLRG